MTVYYRRLLHGHRQKIVDIAGFFRIITSLLYLL